MQHTIGALLRGLSSDVIVTLRVLARQRGYAVASILTLALGIGATTWVFTAIDAALLRPLPYRAPDELVGLSSVQSGPDQAETQFVPSQIELVRWRRAASFETIEAVEPRSVTLTGAGEPEMVAAGAVTSGLFPMLGVAPDQGRVFTADEERTDAPLAVISRELWQRKFTGDPRELGKSIVIDGQAFQVIGIMPANTRPLLLRAEVWTPLHPVDDAARQNLRIMAVAGRLRPSATRQQAAAELTAISERLASEFPTSHGHMSPLVQPLKEQLFGRNRPGLMMLAAGVLLLLVLACVNVLNLAVGHLVTRRPELAVRAALGATRWQLARLQLVETIIIAGIGGALGVGAAAGAVPALATFAAGQQQPFDPALDWRAVLFAAVATCGTVLMTGLLPALRARGASNKGGMRDVATVRVGGGRWERRLRAGLVVLQVAMAVALLCGASAFTASFRRLLSTKPGFSSDGVLTLQLMLAPARYPDATSRARAVGEIVDRVAAIPGVVAAGTTQTTFQPNQSMQTGLWLEGRPIDAEHTLTTNIRHITPGYFQALRVPIVEGRAIDERDQMGAPMVCMVSAQFARQFSPDHSIVGRRVRRLAATAPWLTVVGVAADVMDAGLGVNPGPTFYVPYLQNNTPTARVSLVVRTSGDPSRLAADVRRAIWAVDPMQAVSDVRRLDDLLTESTGDQRFQTMLLGAFGVIGLVLALVGVYGVTSAAIRSRTWEVGVRMSLGATPERVVSDVMREAGLQVAIGVTAGLLLFAAAGRAASGLLYDTSLGEPVLLVAAIAPLVLAALGVSYALARRLAHISLVAALRNDSA